MLCSSGTAPEPWAPWKGNPPEPSMASGRPCNILLLGPPAAGKGTQAEFLVGRYGLVHVSAGDLLRSRIQHLPELAEFVNSGRLVPDDLIVALMRDRLRKDDCATRGVLLDGFPRTRAQAEALRSAGVDVAAVVHLQVADEVVVQRIACRRIDPISGKIYHTTDNPPPPEVADRVIQRGDDTEDNIRTRLAAYHAEKEAIMEFYGPLVMSIRVGGASLGALPADAQAEQVFDEVRKRLESDAHRGPLPFRPGGQRGASRSAGLQAAEAASVAYAGVVPPEGRVEAVSLSPSPSGQGSPRASAHGTTIRSALGVQAAGSSSSLCSSPGPNAGVRGAEASPGGGASSHAGGFPAMLQARPFVSPSGVGSTSNAPDIVARL